jgi:hypothetical protein
MARKMPKSNLLNVLKAKASHQSLGSGKYCRHHIQVAAGALNPHSSQYGLCSLAAGTGTT